MRRVSSLDLSLALGLAMLVAAKPSSHKARMTDNTATLPPSEPRVRKFTDARKAEKAKRLQAKKRR